MGHNKSCGISTHHSQVAPATGDVKSICVYKNYQTRKKGCATDPCFRGPAKVSNVNLNVSHNAVDKQNPPGM